MANKVWIKKFDVEQIIKTKGIEIQINSNDGQIGDLQIKKTGLVWCEGRKSKNVTKFSYDELDWIAYYKADVMKAVKAAKKRDGQ